MDMLLGILAVAAGGLIMGSGAWPFKLMRYYQFEHWWFVGMLVGLIVVPWTITLAGCPGVLGSLGELPWRAVLVGNLLAVGWGIANILCGLCFVRIGVALTGAILAGLGVSVGAIVPLVFKGSGRFENSPDLFSSSGIMVIVGVGVMLTGVLVAAAAGFGRDRQLRKVETTSGGFWGGLLMAATAGVLSAFLALSFVYSQGPIIEHLGRLQGADLGQGGLVATFGVFAFGLLGGAALNVGYAAYLMTKNRSWPVLACSVKELVLAVIIGVNFGIAATLMGRGMLLLGALGASVGFGIQQAMQMTGNQALGFLSGEWRGVTGKPRLQMYLAIALLIAAACIMGYGNTLTAK